MVVTVHVWNRQFVTCNTLEVDSSRNLPHREQCCEVVSHMDWSCTPVRLQIVGRYELITRRIALRATPILRLVVMTSVATEVHVRGSNGALHDAFAEFANRVSRQPVVRVYLRSVHRRDGTPQG